MSSRKAEKYIPPKIVACELDGRRGYWRAIHPNGLVQTVKGTHAEAVRRVKQVVDRLNAFEEWCRRPTASQRIKLL